MSGESDDPLYQSSGALLFPDLTDNGEELDFTKDFFSDTLNQSNELNGGSYESLGGDLIAELGGQDVFSRLGPLELDDGTSPFGDVELKGGTSLPSPSTKKPFANGQVLPTYGSFQKPSINLAHMNAGGFGGPVSEMYMPRNGVTGLASPSSPALTSSGLLSPGATSEKLNSLSLDHQQQVGYTSYRPSAYDVKSNVPPRAFPHGGPYSQGGGGGGGGVVAHGSGGGTTDMRFVPSSLASPSVSTQPNSNGITTYSSTGGGGGQDMASGLIAASVSDVMHSSASQHPMVRSPDGASPRSLSKSTSVDSKDSSVVDGMLVTGAADGKIKIQQQSNKPLFLSSPGLAHRLGSTVESSGFMDANGDALRPLPQSSRSSAMQRSFSSHALGQLRNAAPMAQAASSDQAGGGAAAAFPGIGSSDALPSRLSNESGSSHVQPKVSDMQNNLHIRPIMQSMRRVHSTGDIQTLNGLAGGSSSPSALERATFEDGGFKIGRYTAEERKIRIHRYQQKRTQRNFNKKIKYACRKTLADSRPRVRGRFAKNDEVGEPLVKHESKDEDEEEDNLMYEEEEFFVEEDSSGDLSDMLGINGVKAEHPATLGMTLEQQQQQQTDRKQQPLQP